MSDRTSYPLCWPEGWPRVPMNERQDSRFIHGGRVNGIYAYSNRRRYSMDEASRLLIGELERLGADSMILSTNTKLKLNGLPYSNLSTPADSGAAVYFKLNKREVSLACGKWRRVECNIVAIARHIEALRGQERWGVGSIEQAFRGYMALAGIGQSSNENPWATLGVPINAGQEAVKEAFRALAKKFHTDNPHTGDRDRFERLKHAYDMLAQNFR